MRSPDEAVPDSRVSANGPDIPYNTRADGDWPHAEQEHACIIRHDMGPGNSKDIYSTAYNMQVIDYGAGLSTCC
jgi:hypothetical protein